MVVQEEQCRNRYIQGSVTSEPGLPARVSTRGRVSENKRSVRRQGQEILLLAGEGAVERVVESE